VPRINLNLKTTIFLGKHARAKVASWKGATLKYSQEFMY